MTDLFVTGTDIGVGKTLVSAALCRLRPGTVYVKPVQPGAADGDDDAADVAALAGVPTVAGPVVGPSLAPGVAARRAGAELLLSELVDVVAGARATHPDRPLVVEGVGGLLEDLTSDGRTCADLATALGLAVIVVARPGAGTVNHVALTVGELERRGLELAGVVVSGHPTAPDPAARADLIELDRRSGGRLVGVVPSLPAVTPAAVAEAAAWMTAALGGHADRRDWLEP